jgi:hypothetical protein
MQSVWFTGVVRAQPSQEPCPVKGLRAAVLNAVWSWDITYLPTTERGFWLLFVFAERRLEPQGPCLGRRRTRRPSHFCWFDEEVLLGRDDQRQP